MAHLSQMGLYNLPRVVLTTSTTAWQALMLEMIWPRPEESSVPSLRMTICGC